MKRLIQQWKHVDGNDVNGNPRRLWVVMDAEMGTICGVINEGFRGAPTQANYVELPQVWVKGREYQGIIKYATERGIYDYA